MKRKKIKVFDSIFSHNPYSCYNCDSEYMEWILNPKEINDGDIVFFTENDLDKVLLYKDRNKIVNALEEVLKLKPSFNIMCRIQITYEKQFVDTKRRNIL